MPSSVVSPINSHRSAVSINGLRGHMARVPKSMVLFLGASLYRKPDNMYRVYKGNFIFLKSQQYVSTRGLPGDSCNGNSE